LLLFLLVEVAQAAVGCDSDCAVGIFTWPCVEKKYCQSDDGPKTRRSVVLDVAERLGVFAVGKVWFARGRARYRTRSGVN
jgi:hypothetical protein